MTIDFRPSRRVRNTDLMRTMKLECDCCEITGTTERLALHHVRYRSQSGSDVRANIVCLSADLHIRYHAADPVARRLVGEHIKDHRPDTMSYLVSVMGEEATREWLQTHLKN